jgi:DHA1 family bicyclomycin/chloramphenicol resistance-like MFS transporter
MVRDLFPVRDIPKVFSLLMLVVGLSPMLAPTVGIRYSSLWLAWFFLMKQRKRTVITDNLLSRYGEPG